MKYLFLILLLLSVLISANAQGVNFDHTLNWEQVKAKAKAENKYIFADCYGSYCAPCIKMLKDVFPRKEMGDFFNDKFICLKLQLDRTSKDDEYVKMWYNDVEMIVKKYGMPSLPTFFFFSPDGELVHRVPGIENAKSLIAKAADALDPGRQYYTMMANFEKSTRKEPEMMMRLAIAAQGVMEREHALKYASQYLETQNDLLTKENIMFLSRFTTARKDKGFEVFLNHGYRVDEVLGKGQAAERVRGIIYTEELMPLVAKIVTGVPDWKSLQAAIAEKYPLHAEAVVAKYKVQYYQGQQNWKCFQETATVFMKKYGNDLHPQELNNFAWAVFENISDKNGINLAMDWINRSPEKDHNEWLVNTYANLLYKSGQVKEAIAMQEKAIYIADTSVKQDYLSNLEKMKKGQKTWLQ
ncbi:thioredoxin family protein [Pedobacter sp. MC2016-14]|uniref:thioredoxin family protein n=1 Tax=Pedobacter sp. MC2016-14 TaxID=2897327 RepID=UPI001E3AEA5A|nr:thioredoxin family protein [Pedobacter sp. MC2016-14]MCD0488623.1 thioredoxin family protein [Pedobacter sp. MC2016-14]